MKGLDTVKKNLIKIGKQQAEASLAGVVAGGLILKREAMKRTPVAFGNLRNSAYLVWKEGKDEDGRFIGDDAGEMSAQHNQITGQHQQAMGARRQPTATVGYSAVYALSVHENPNAGSGKGLERITAAMYTRRKKSKASAASIQRARGVAVTGQWKFLATAMNANQKEIKAAMVRYTKKGLKP